MNVNLGIEEGKHEHFMASVRLHALCQQNTSKHLYVVFNVLHMAPMQKKVTKKAYNEGKLSYKWNTQNSSKSAREYGEKGSHKSICFGKIKTMTMQCMKLIVRKKKQQ